MIAVLAALSLMFAAHGAIRSEIAGQNSWRIVHEQTDAIIAYRETGREAQQRQVWLVTTAVVSDQMVQRYFVHTLDCANWTQTRDELGLTDPTPRVWTPEDGPPLVRPATTAEQIGESSPMEMIAQEVCRGRRLTLPTIEGDWTTVTTALRQRLMRPN